MVLDAITQVELFVNVFIGVYTLVVFLYVLTSWIRLPYSMRPVQNFLNDVCDPYLNLWRRILPRVGMFDLSPLAGLIGLIVLRETCGRCCLRLSSLVYRGGSAQSNGSSPCNHGACVATIHGPARVSTALASSTAPAILRAAPWLPSRRRRSAPIEPAISAGMVPMPNAAIVAAPRSGSSDSIAISSTV